MELYCILVIIVDFYPTFYCLPKPLFLYGSMVLFSTLLDVLQCLSFLIKIRAHLDLLSIPPLWGGKCQNV